MNEWLLLYLDGSPDCRFYEWQLRMRCKDFEEMLSAGLLVRDLEAEESEFCFTKWGQHLQLVRLDGAIFGVDTENPDEPIAEVDPRELIQYRFNIGLWQEMIRKANGLQGVASRLHEHLLFLGEKTEGGLNLGFVLGFFSRRDMALDLLLSLPARIPCRYDAIVVTTPLSSPLSQQEIANLERLGVYVVPPLNRQTLTIECPRLPPKRREMPSVVLSPELEEEFHLYGYNCRLPIYISGERTKSGNNVILIGKNRIEAGDTPFALFLRLVLGLHRSKCGAVPKAELQREGYLSEDSEFQSIHQLRWCFLRALGNLDPKDFIEVYRPKTLRLSVHPSLISYDRNRLLEHDNAMVRRLAEELPALSGVQTIPGRATKPAWSG